MKVSDLRREYSLGSLSENDVLAEPMAQFDLWLQQAIDAKINDPTAMVVATVDNNGQPSQRIVLLKGSDEGGFVFFTNLGSRKAQELKQNPKISLHFPWHILERQVIVYGEVQSLSKTENASYFLSRPKESQLAAWASEQSHPVSSRSLLMQTFERMKQKFKHGEVPTPDFWGGYRVIPHKIEFWQGGEYRLHDRILYDKVDSGWQISRLAP
ncbi:MAG: pyridoxamine 5'-phosphate oxidase [Gammaproteobacteria bacterium]|nr:pyridoxamine 5'-phosphate oxidase [Gammaproteobacteria bacterium]